MTRRSGSTSPLSSKPRSSLGRFRSAIARRSSATSVTRHRRPTPLQLYSRTAPSCNVIGTGGSRSLPLDDFFTGPGRRFSSKAKSSRRGPAAAAGADGGRIRAPYPPSRRGPGDRQSVLRAARIWRRRDLHLAQWARGRFCGVPARHAGRRNREPRHARSDLRGGADYRMAMLPILARRALNKATARLGHG